MTRETGWRVAVGSDEAGFDYKQTIRDDLWSDPRVTELRDFGVESGESRAYPDVGLAVAEAVARGEVDRGVLFCGTGIGMAISANKVTGVRATPVSDAYSCERSVLSNNCQVLCLGQRVIGLEVARRLVADWFGYEFDPSSPSGAKVALISAYEGKRG